MVEPLGKHEDWLRKKGKGEVRGKEQEGPDVGSTTDGKSKGAGGADERWEVTI